MPFSTIPYPYQRGIPPVSPESQVKYLQEELKKLERAFQAALDALNELEARCTAANI